MKSEKGAYYNSNVEIPTSLTQVFLEIYSLLQKLSGYIIRMIVSYRRFAMITLLEAISLVLYYISCGISRLHIQYPTTRVTVTDDARRITVQHSQVPETQSTSPNFLDEASLWAKEVLRPPNQDLASWSCARVGPEADAVCLPPSRRSHPFLHGTTGHHPFRPRTVRLPQ